MYILLIFFLHLTKFIFISVAVVIRKEKIVFEKENRKILKIETFLVFFRLLIHYTFCRGEIYVDVCKYVHRESPALFFYISSVLDNSFNVIKAVDVFHLNRSKFLFHFVCLATLATLELLL